LCLSGNVDYAGSGNIGSGGISSANLLISGNGMSFIFDENDLNLDTENQLIFVDTTSGNSLDITFSPNMYTDLGGNLTHKCLVVQKTQNSSERLRKQ